MVFKSVIWNTTKIENQPLYTLFIDFQKAFDSINRMAIMRYLYKANVPQTILDVIE